MKSLSLLRSTWRSLRRSPSTSILAVVALALGIGLTATMYNLVAGVLWAEVSFPNVDRMVDLESFQLEIGPSDFYFPSSEPYDFFDWQELSTSFAELGAANLRSVNLGGEDGFPERLSAGFVTASMFSVLGQRPALGRTFDARDDVPGAPRVVLLGDALWHRRFAGDRKIVGESVRINGELATVIGVMPPGFEFPVFEDLWIPLRLDMGQIKRGEGDALFIIGLLADGVDLATAQTELSAITARLGETYPASNAGYGVLLEGYRDSLNNRANTTLMGSMLAATCLVLVIACANVASLLLARASLRAKELAIRSALGAHRLRVIGLIVAESLLLSTLGTFGGVALAYVGVHQLNQAFSWMNLPFWIRMDMQPSVVAFAAAAGIAAGLLAGFIPALRASGAVTFDLLKDESRGSSGMRIGRLSRLLVIAEITCACALLVVTGLMVRTVVSYNTIDPGFAIDSISTAGLTLPEADYPEAADRIAFHETLIAELERHPEIEAAAVMSAPPATYMGFTHYGLEGETYATPADYPGIACGTVSPGFFATYDISLLEGRLFDRHDDLGSPGVVVVNESFAAEIWPGEEALGKRLRLGRGDEKELWRSVVGVVPDAGVSLLNPAVAGISAAGIYLPHAQQGFAEMSLVIKSRGKPPALAEVVREQVRRLDAGLPLADEKTMERVMWEQTFSTKVIGLMFSIFGLVALLLASVGIFGVTMFSVSQRTSEIGIRMALGAGRAEILKLIMRQGLGRLAIGLTAGLGLAALLAQGLRMFLFGVEPTDPTSFIGAAGALVAVVLLASFLPAYRASRVDPLVSLHYE